MPNAPITPDSHVYLVDASAYIFRAYHALPPLTRASDGAPVGAVSGFCNMLWKLLEDLKKSDRPTHFACIFDKSAQTFRNALYPDYKANRAEPPDDLRPQFPLVREAARAFHTHALEQDGYEADDLIATYARQAAARNARVTIVSSDKDLMQLVTDQILMLDTMKNRVIDVDAVHEKFGVAPGKVIDVQALAGDSTDNIPGAPGIGIKTAATLIAEFGTLDTLLERAGEIKQPKRRQTLIDYADQIRLSRKLVTLKDDVALDVPLSALAVCEPDPETLITFLERMEFRTITRRVREALIPDKTGHAGEGDDRRHKIDRNAYVTINDTDTLETWIADATEQGHVAIDTETDSLDAQKAGLVGISLALAPGRACYIPLAHVTANGPELFRPAPDQIDLHQALQALKPLFENPAILKIGQNLKYDMAVLDRYGISLDPIDDTILLSFVLNAGRHKHGLDELSKRYLQHTPLAFTDVCGSGAKQISFAHVTIETATAYAAEDADLALRLWQYFKPQLHKARVTTVYETLERPLVRVLADMEACGIGIDHTYLARLSDDFLQRMAIYESTAHEQAGTIFNPGSPKQVGDILFEKMQLEGGKKTRTGAWKTGADTLADLAANGHELPKTILDWRSVSKLRSTYTEILPKQINPRTGRVHTNYGMTGAQTGRLSSNDPNLQNIPIRSEEGRTIREAFIAKPGNLLVSADYSQIELRLLADIAGIDALKQAFHDRLDIHAMTASEIFSIPIKGMDPSIRRRAKAINFGIIYGISAYGLARQLAIPRSEAQHYINAYLEKFSGIRAYMEAVKAYAARNGRVETIFGRVIHLQGMKAKGPERAFAERQAINAPIQGSAADIIKRAMIRIPGALKRAGLEGKMLLQVHDELIFETPESEVDRLIRTVTHIMETALSPAYTLSVPLVVEARAGKNWSEAH